MGDLGLYQGLTRVDFSSGWKNQDDWSPVSGVILPVGGGFGIVSGWFAGGLFQ